MGRASRKTLADRSGPALAASMVDGLLSMPCTILAAISGFQDLLPALNTGRIEMWQNNMTSALQPRAVGVSVLSTATIQPSELASGLPTSRAPARFRPRTKALVAAPLGDDGARRQMLLGLLSAPTTLARRN